jgi:hypothetical protein
MSKGGSALHYFCIARSEHGLIDDIPISSFPRHKLTTKMLLFLMKLFSALILVLGLLSAHADTGMYHHYVLSVTESVEASTGAHFESVDENNRFTFSLPPYHGIHVVFYCNESADQAKISANAAQAEAEVVYQWMKKRSH